MSLEQRRFTDPDELTAALASGSGSYKVLSRGAFHAELTVMRLGHVTLQSAHERLARVAYHSMHPEKVGVLGWPRGGPLPVVRGAQPRAEDLIGVGGGTESYHRSSAGVDYVALVLDADVLAQVAIDVVGRELRLEDGLACLRSSPDVASLMATIADLRRIARSSPQIFESGDAVRALEQSLLLRVIACLPVAAPRRELAVDTRRARIMARFEAVVEAHGARPLHVPELCRLVGVPERTLRKCCQQHLGMGPHRYLLRRRIHLARRALQRSDSSSETVTSIATNLGFWEFGRFAVMYRSTFGEPPSATRRRQQAEFA